MNKDCTFCKIIKNEEFSYILFESEKSLLSWINTRLILDIF